MPPSISPLPCRFIVSLHPCSSIIHLYAEDPPAIAGIQHLLYAAHGRVKPVCLRRTFRLMSRCPSSSAIAELRPSVFTDDISRFQPRSVLCSRPWACILTTSTQLCLAFLPPGVKRSQDPFASLPPFSSTMSQTPALSGSAACNMRPKRRIL